MYITNAQHETAVYAVIIRKNAATGRRVCCGNNCTAATVGIKPVGRSYTYARAPGI